MMPGVVAGFPRAEDTGVTMNSETDGYLYGYYTDGWITSPLGSMEPAGATVVPGGPPNPGGLGEIVEWYWHSGNNWVVLVFRGPYANLAAIPFSSAEINGNTFSKAAAFSVMGYGSSTIRMEWNRSAPTPMPAGRLVGKFT